MLEKSNMNKDILWKQRFYAPSIHYSQIASQNQSHGILISNRDGKYQIYTWEVDTDQLRQLTYHENGVGYGIISADGEHAYYLSDDQGNELGHYYSVAWNGGTPTDITPDLPPYASFWITESYSGKYLGLVLQPHIMGHEGTHGGDNEHAVHAIDGDDARLTSVEHGQIGVLTMV